MSREAMKLALGKIKSARDCHFAAIDTLLFEAEEILEEALAEPPAQKCSYPYCGCNSKAWCKVERNEALDKMAENERELGIQMQPAQDDPCPGCRKGAVCRTPKCGRLKLPVDHPYRSEQPEQREPVAFLANGTRFKISYDSRQSGGQIHGIPPELGGRWVAFVAADDDCHLKRTSPPAQRTWVGLTDEEIEAEFGFIDELLRDCCYRTAAKLKEKNGL